MIGHTHDMDAQSIARFRGMLDQVLPTLEKRINRLGETMYPGKTHGTDAEKFGEFKHHLWLLLNAMQKTLHRSHPSIAIAGGQTGEDQILADLLPGSTGCYVDVGASEPVNCSNTWQFYQRGWRGLLVECLPSAWHALLRQRPGDLLCPLAAYDAPGFAKLRVANSVSSLRPDWDIQESGELVVECDTLANILSGHPTIRDNCSLLSLDVEGAEGKVVAGIDWNTFHPRVIVIEKDRYHGSEKDRNAWHKTHGEQSDDLSGEWHGTLDKRYRLHAETALNRIYVGK